MTDERRRLTIVPLTFREACEVVDLLHRHHKRPQGHRFSIGVQRPDGTLCGVAVIGRPVSRVLDNRFTVEVTRVATDGTPHACSALYGAAWGAASRMGFRRAVTYTQDGESGASLRAVGWQPVAALRPRTGWDTPSRHRSGRGTDHVARVLWQQHSQRAPGLPEFEDLRDAMPDEILCAAVGCGRPFPLREERGRLARYCSAACRVHARGAARQNA